MKCASVVSLRSAVGGLPPNSGASVFPGAAPTVVAPPRPPCLTPPLSFPPPRKFGTIGSSTSTPTGRGAAPWSRVASISPVAPPGRPPRRDEGMTAPQWWVVTQPPPLAAVDDDCDISTSGGWMERLERTEGLVNEEGGAGAYDVLRCDLVRARRWGATGEEVSRRLVWGRSFHLDRLRNSYRALIREKSKGGGGAPVTVSETVLDEAMEQSEAILDAILAEAESSTTMRKLGTQLNGLGDGRLSEKSQRTGNGEDVLTQLVKVAILWTPPPTPAPSSGLLGLGGTDRLSSDGGAADASDLRIKVRGHASSNGKSFPAHLRPASIVATVALPTKTPAALSHRGADKSVAQPLPSRSHNSQIKVASWARQRHTLENSGTYKPPGVGEVLLVRPTAAASSGTEVLEGLTSNFFAIYKDGTLRTAQEGVLFGYARHLVLECAPNVPGLRVDDAPILLEDSDEWAETFITSSSRLIYPIKQILVPDDSVGGGREQHKPGQGMRFKELWSAPPPPMGPNRIDDSILWEAPRWELLYDEMLRRGGY